MKYNLGTENKIEIIKNYCIIFRSAIEKCDKKLMPISFRNFPNGSCGDTVTLLGTYLFDNYMGEFNYVVGCKNGKSHAWLKNDEGLIVDITADQFPEIVEKVIVSCNSEWHNNFNFTETLHTSHFNIYDSNNDLRIKSELESAYKTICNHIKLIE